jgi:hypothetical protein
MPARTAVATPASLLREMFAATPLGILVHALREMAQTRGGASATVPVRTVPR